MDVFISYSTKDEELANSICYVLERTRVKCWIAPRNIDTGKKYTGQIMEGLRSCKCMVLVESKHSNDSEQVENEIAIAADLKKITVIPYKIDGASFKHLSMLQRINASDDPYGKFDELIAEVCKLLGRDMPDKTSHSVKNLKKIKPIKKISGKITIFALAFELFIASVYLTMNISKFFLFAGVAVLIGVIIYPIIQRKRCSYIGCKKRCLEENIEIKLKSKKSIAKFHFCNEHKHTFSKDKSTGNNIIFSYIGIVIIAMMMFLAVIKYDITFISFVQVSSDWAILQQSVTDAAIAKKMSKSISAQERNAVYILNDGTVSMYDNSLYDSEKIKSFDGITEISASDTHIVALRFDGTVYTSGQNGYGQCDIADKNTEKIISISAGNGFTLLLTENSTVLGFGENDNGQIDFDSIDNIEQISAGASHSLALVHDGQVIATGSNEFGQCDVSDWSDIIQISAGQNISAALKTDGTVVTTAGAVDWKDIVYVSAGDGLVVGLTKKGEALLAGDDNNLYNTVSTWENIITVDVYKNHIVGLKSDFTLTDASLDGKSYVGEYIIKIGTVLNSDACVFNNMKTLSVCENYALTLSDDLLEIGGTIPDIEFIDFNNLLQIKTGKSMTVGLKQDGTVVCAGAGCGLFDVFSWNDIIMTDLSQDHIVGLKSDGTLVADGDNSYGQCDVENLSDVTFISIADTHTLCVHKDGTVTALGDNSFQQCVVQGFSEIKQIDTGLYHTAAVKYDGTVVAVGKNDLGQCEISEWTDIALVAVGDSFTIGLKTDGHVVTVGDIDLTVYGIANNIIAVDALHNSFALLRTDGRLITSFD